MIGGRFLIGWGVGLASCIAPLYIQELAPTRQRGRMVVVNVVAITGGACQSVKFRVDPFAVAKPTILGQVIAYGERNIILRYGGAYCDYYLII